MRLEDVGEAEVLEASCLCGHAAIIDPGALRARFAGYTRIIEIEKKLRCRECGSRGVNTLRVGRLVR